MNNKQPLNIPAIAVMYLLFFMIAFVTNFAGSMGVILKNQYAISNALTQLGSLANFLAYACMGIPAGIILRNKGYKFSALLAVTIGFVGVGVQWLSGTVGGFYLYVCGAFIAGFSMCMLNVVVNPMLNTLGGGGNVGNQLIQFGGSCNSIGGTLAPILLGYLIGGEMTTANVAAAAPAMIAAMAIFVVAFLVILFSHIPEPHIATPEQRNAHISNKDPYGPMHFRHFVLGAVAIFFYVGVEVGIPNMANLYMSNNPLVGPSIAGTVVGIYWLCMMLGRFIGGAIGGKVNPRLMLASVCLLAIVFLTTIILLPETATIHFRGVRLPISMLLMVVCGLCTSVMWGTIFNLSTEGLGKHSPTASGIFMACVCGGGLIPFLQGGISDLFEGISKAYLYSYILLILCLIYILFYALIGSKNVNKNISTE